MRRKAILLWAAIWGFVLLQGWSAKLSAAQVPLHLPPVASPLSARRVQGPAFPFREGYAADSGGSGHEEHNRLILPRQQIAEGDPLSAEIRVYGNDYFFNVYWNRQLPLPGELALYDSKMQWVCDLAASAGNVRQTPIETDWTLIEAHGYAGTVLHCGALHVPAGSYYVQAIFFGSLIHPLLGRNADGWPAIDDQTELMRSEAIPITVTASKPAESVIRANRRSDAQPFNQTSERSPLVFSGAQPGESALSFQNYPFRDASPIPQAQGWGHRGHSVLSVPSPILRFGNRFSADVCQYNDGGTNTFFNVYWNELMPLPGGLALYDGQKRFVCNLLASYGGSHVGLGTSEWTGIDVAGFAGTTLSVSLPSLSGIGDPHVRHLPAGTYYLQVIYVSGAVAPPEKDKWNLFFGTYTKPNTSSEGQVNAFRTQEVFRSNAVKVTIVE